MKEYFCVIVAFFVVLCIDLRFYFEKVFSNVFKCIGGFVFFTSIARKCFVFVYNYFMATVFCICMFKYIWRVFCPSLHVGRVTKSITTQLVFKIY